MTKYFITRRHIRPDSDEQAAICAVRGSTDDDADWNEAKAVMSRMVVNTETAEKATPFLLGLILMQQPVETAYGFVGATWTFGNIRWSIAEQD